MYIIICISRIIVLNNHYVDTYCINSKTKIITVVLIVQRCTHITIVLIEEEGA